ncbi:MAG TPA: L-threonine 3-dehydrogenase [Candidatus Eisenbacteria bacterium]|nr:L-threonine 3-dehydrogenase [Candidatus Eisenbacteria bacterium]
MKAWVKSRPAPGAELAEVPDPVPAPDEVLLKVRRVAICGTDLHIYKWDRWAQEKIHPPLIFGHEFVGEVVGMGAQVRGHKLGDLVAVETHVACGHCRLCRRNLGHVCENMKIVGIDRPGAYAERVAIPAVNAWPVPHGMPLEQAAALEPLGNAVHSVLAGEIAGCSVAVTGCGPIGLFAICVARACGAGPILATDVNDYRLELARSCGADRTVQVKRENWVDAAREMTAGEGVDVVCEMSGQPTVIVESLKALRNAGRLSLLGLSSQDLTFDFSQLLIFKGITIQGILGRRMFETWHQMTSLLESGRLDISKTITHVMPLADLEDAMRTLAAQQAGKIVLVPWGETTGGPAAKRSSEREPAGTRA